VSRASLSGLRAIASRLIPNEFIRLPNTHFRGDAAFRQRIGGIAFEHLDRYRAAVTPGAGYERRLPRSWRTGKDDAEQFVADSTLEGTEFEILVPLEDCG
jgi:hypothetical protein